MKFYRLIKKIIDPLMALVSMIILSPLFLLIAILIKKDSKGPVIFKQKRIGHNKKTFTMYKFRTMVKDAQKLKKKYKHLDFTNGPVFKIKNDPRLTKIGKVLAKTNLDELPQLFNILRGDMYFVGFRPPIKEEVSHYKKWQLKRFKSYPGLTSLWAISGMHKMKFDDWIKMDLDYNKNESVFLDLTILCKTSWNFLKRIVNVFYRG